MGLEQHMATVTHISAAFDLHSYARYDQECCNSARHTARGRHLDAIDLAKQPGLLHRLQAILND